MLLSTVPLLMMNSTGLLSDPEKEPVVPEHDTDEEKKTMRSKEDQYLSLRASLS